MPLVVDVLIDESASTETSDPQGLRHSEAEAIAAWMSRYSGNPHDRFGAIRFASIADGVSPVPVARAPAALARLFRRSVRALGGGTTLGPAVTLAVRQLAPYRDDRRVAIILSDGQISDLGALRHLVRELRAAADSVYMIGLDGDGTWHRSTHKLYDDLGLTDVLQLGRLSKNQLAQTVAEIVLRETGQRVAPAPTQVGASS